MATGCIPGQGYLGKNGYVWVTGSKLAHRVAYEEARGPIPKWLEIDHLCRNRACVNPDHLEAVSHRRNVRRGMGFAGEHFRQTHCIRGHPFTPENTYLRTRPEGGRECRACRKERREAR